MASKPREYEVKLLVRDTIPIYTKRGVAGTLRRRIENGVSLTVRKISVRRIDKSEPTR